MPVPVITVSCLPKCSQRRLKKIFDAIIQAVESVPELGLRGEKSMTVLFPPDSMKYGLGTEIVIQVTGLFEKPERTEEVRNRLAASLGKTIKGLFPKAMIECFVHPFNPRQGFWTNPRMGRRHKPTADEWEDVTEKLSVGANQP